MGNIPTWLVEWLLKELTVVVTPEKIATLEAAAKAYLVCELETLVGKSVIGKDVADAIGVALGVDTTKCKPAA